MNYIKPEDVAWEDEVQPQQPGQAPVSLDVQDVVWEDEDQGQHSSQAHAPMGAQDIVWDDEQESSSRDQHPSLVQGEQPGLLGRIKEFLIRPDTEASGAKAVVELAAKEAGMSPEEFVDRRLGALDADQTFPGTMYETARAVPRGAMQTVASIPRGGQVLYDAATKPDRPTQEGSAYRMGESISDTAERLFPDNPDYQQNFITQMGEAMGSLGTFLVTGGAGRGIAAAGARGFGLSQKASKAATMAGQWGTAFPMAGSAGIDEAYHHIQDFNQQNPDLALNEEDARKVASMGAFPGMVQVLSLGPLLKRVPAGMRSSATTYLLKRMRDSGATEFTVETAGAVLQDALRQTYDSEHEVVKNITRHIKERGATAGTAAMALQALMFRGQMAGTQNRIQSLRQKIQNEQQLSGEEVSFANEVGFDVQAEVAEAQEQARKTSAERSSEIVSRKIEDGETVDLTSPAKAETKAGPGTFLSEDVDTAEISRENIQQAMQSEQLFEAWRRSLEQETGKEYSRQEFQTLLETEATRQDTIRKQAGEITGTPEQRGKEKIQARLDQGREADLLHPERHDPQPGQDFPIDLQPFERIPEGQDTPALGLGMGVDYELSGPLVAEARRMEATPGLPPGQTGPAALPSQNIIEMEGAIPMDQAPVRILPEVVPADIVSPETALPTEGVAQPVPVARELAPAQQPVSSEQSVPSPVPQTWNELRARAKDLDIPLTENRRIKKKPELTLEVETALLEQDGRAPWQDSRLAQDPHIDRKAVRASRERKKPRRKNETADDRKMVTRLRYKDSGEAVFNRSFENTSQAWQFFDVQLDRAKKSAEKFHLPVGEQDLMFTETREGEDVGRTEGEYFRPGYAGQGRGGLEGTGTYQDGQKNIADEIESITGRDRTLEEIESQAQSWHARIDEQVLLPEQADAEQWYNNALKGIVEEKSQRRNDEAFQADSVYSHKLEQYELVRDFVFGKIKSEQIKEASDGWYVKALQKKWGPGLFSKSTQNVRDLDVLVNEIHEADPSLLSKYGDETDRYKNFADFLLNDIQTRTELEAEYESATGYKSPQGRLKALEKKSDEPDPSQPLPTGIPSLTPDAQLDSRTTGHLTKSPEDHGQITREEIETEIKNDDVRFARRTPRPESGFARDLDNHVRQAIQVEFPALADMVEVVESETELPGRILKSLEAQDMLGGYHALHDAADNKIYIVAENVSTTDAADKAYITWLLAHEGRHAALDYIFGSREAKKALMRQVARAKRKEVSDYLTRWGMEDNLANRTQAAEEILADMTKQDVMSPLGGRPGRLVDQFLSKVLEWVRKVFPDLRITKAEIRDLISRADEIIATVPDVTAAGEAAEGLSFARENKKFWPADFPSATTHTTLSKLKKHPDYRAAKAGDIQAAIRVVGSVINPAKIQALKKKHPDAIVVAPHAQEATGRNAIPEVLADAFGDAGFEVDTSIVQANRAERTDKDSVLRLVLRPEFEGEVRPGRQYIIIDDAIGQGGTVSELRHFIENSGGEVVHVSALTAGIFGNKISVNQQTIASLQEKFGHEQLQSFLREFNVAGRIEALTEKEGRFILRQVSLDSLRNRILKEAQERNIPASAWEVQASVRGQVATSQDPSLNFARKSKSPGSLSRAFAKAQDQVKQKQQDQSFTFSTETPNADQDTSSHLGARALEFKFEAQDEFSFDDQGFSFTTSRTAADDVAGSPVNSAGLPIDLDASGIDTAALKSSTGSYVSSLFESASDRLRQAGLGSLAEKVDKYFDNWDRRLGKVNIEIKRAFREVKKHGEKKTLEKWEQYQGHLQNGREAQAREILDSSPGLQTLVKTWEGLAEWTGTENQNIKTPYTTGMKVWDAKTQDWRNIGKIGKNFFPRTLRREVQQVLMNPATDQALFNQLVDALIAEGHISKRNQVARYLRNYFSSEIRQDYFAGIEKARGEALPEVFYDYTWTAASRYLNKWAQRVAQVEQFGQAYAGVGDWFDININKIRDKRTQHYVDSVRERVYNVTKQDPFTNAMNLMNLLATGTQLGNPATAGLNFVGGTTLNAQMYGLRRVARAYKDLLSNWRQVQDAGVELGILGKDLLNLLNDADANSEGYWDTQSKLKKNLGKFASFTMKYGGYKPTENLIRATSMLAARSWLVDVLKSSPGSITHNKFMDFTKEHNLNFRKLMTEGGRGQETAKYLRKAVNIPQGSYRIDMVPVFTDSPVGRFLFKYQKFGTQVTRMFYQNHLKPMLRAKTGRDRAAAFMHTLRFFGLGVLGGTVVAQMRQELFNYLDPGPEMDELEKALENEDLHKTWTWIFSRAWHSMNAAGILGFFGNYLQFGADWMDQQRTKNPLDPPGLAVIDTLVELFSRPREQGKLTARDLDQIAQQALSIYRAYKRMGLRALEEVGVEAHEVKLNAAERDRRYVRKMNRRFSDEMDIEHRRVTPAGRMPRTERSVDNQRLYEALITGNGAQARAIVQEAMANAEGAKERKSVKLSMSASARNRQPILVAGVPNEQERQAFLRWAKDNVGAANYERIVRIDREYRRAARQAGVM